MVRTLNSRSAVAALVFYMGLSFWYGQTRHDMNLFAASGGIATVFGLFSIIRFTTIEKYLNQDQIIKSSTGLTGTPVSGAEAERIQRESVERARVRIKAELQSELTGIALTVVGTLVWAYGTYVPVFQAQPQTGTTNCAHTTRLHDPRNDRALPRNPGTTHSATDN